MRKTLYKSAPKLRTHKTKRLNKQVSQTFDSMPSCREAMHWSVTGRNFLLYTAMKAYSGVFCSVINYNPSVKSHTLYVLTWTAGTHRH